MSGKKRYDHITVVPEVFLDFRALKDLSIEGKSDSRFVKELLKVYRLRVVGTAAQPAVVDYKLLNAIQGQAEMEDKE